MRRLTTAAWLGLTFDPTSELLDDPEPAPYFYYFR